ncbi:hypothetical protein [Megalodesulfovibrio paquesii]
MANCSSITGLSPAASFLPLVCVLGDNASALAATLEALHPSQEQAAYPVLFCGHSLERALESLPVPGHATLELLPTPLGRTIGRTWLVMHPLVRAAEWVIFLDAGMLPPPDWLGHLAEAVAAAPDARSWGCRGTRFGALGLDPGHPPLPASPDRLETTAFALRGVEEDIFGPCVHPCLTMPGGCRLFRGDRLQEDGGWNLAFSAGSGPAADVERDLVLALRHGRPACACQHSLCIPAHGGHAASADPRPDAFKLAHRFSPGELETLAMLSRTCHTALPGE